MKSLLIYSSTDGQTKKICEVIKGSSISKDSFELFSIDEAFKINLSDYDQIIIGASIRYGKHSSKIYKFIETHKKILELKKNAFFSVNVVARKKEKSTPETNPYVKKFLTKSKWQPMKLGVFAGKVDYPNLNFFNKIIIKMIMFITNGPTNTKESYEFTDWPSVKRFAQEFDELKV